MRLRILLCLLAASGAQAQNRWADEAVPLYSTAAWVQAFERHAQAPAAARFVQASSALTKALGPGCGAPARDAWASALQAWGTLSAVPTGALVTRRSARQIDFTPTRPERIRTAVAEDQSADAAGSAARGLPALEWLLWSEPPPAGADCAFAQRLAAHLQAEAEAIAAETLPLDDEAAADRAEELLNQWLAGAEWLRMTALLRPRQEAATRGLPAPLWPRARSGQDAAERAARWAALRRLAVRDADTAPDAAREVVPIESLLRGRGLNPLADRLLAATRAVDAALPAADQGSIDALAALRQLMEVDVAAALTLRVGFSDADGD